MKTKVILIVSIVLNAGLAAAYFAARKAVPSPSSAVAIASQQTTNVSIPSRSAQRSPRVVALVTTNQLDWASVESDDYRQYIANLRAIGVPEETIRDIIMADINKLFARRVAALYPSAKDFKFWQAEDRNARAENRQRDQKRRELEREKSALIKELLGVDYEAEMARANGRADENDWRYGFLSPEKQQQVQALQEKYRELQRNLFSTEGGGRNPDARAKFLALRTQQEGEMAQILGPQAFEEYQLRNSMTARNMRENLGSFQPSEEEFRKIFELRRGYDQQFAFPGDDASRQQQQLAQQQLEEQLKTTLGEQRYKEYQLAQDERYRDLSDFAQRSNLPKETVDAVYDMRKAAEDARQKLQSDTSLAPEARQAKLLALAEETRQFVSQALGDTAWKDYQRRDANWIERLAREGGNDRNPAGGRGGAPGFGGRAQGGDGRGRFLRQ